LIQLAATVAVIAIGLVLALVLNTSGDMRFFGWLLVAVGAGGLAARWFIALQRAGRNPPR
jgi:hypothetical protein